MLGYQLKTTLAAALISCMSTTLHAQTYPSEHATLKVDVVAEGLDHPWGVELLPDGAMIVTERSGNLRIVEDGKISQPLSGLPEFVVGGQGGLLDVALAQDFAQSRRLFLSFSRRKNGGVGTAIATGILSGDRSGIQDAKVIFEMAKPTLKGQHFGSRIELAGDGTLFFTIGDRGEPERAQDLADHAGAVLRINPDGTIPTDNPFLTVAGAQPELWSKGHRNPQGAAIDAQTGKLYTVEHGARGGDEINRPEPGRNYGWPTIAYGRNYDGSEIGTGTRNETMEQPLFYWDPSIAPGGMVVYRGDMFPEWDGDFIVAALKYQLISRISRDSDGTVLGEERMLDGEFGRIREIRLAPDGALIALTDAPDGKVLRISRTDG